MFVIRKCHGALHHIRLSCLEEETYFRRRSPNIEIINLSYLFQISFVSTNKSNRRVNGRIIRTGIEFHIWLLRSTPKLIYKKKPNLKNSSVIYVATQRDVHF